MFTQYLNSLKNIVLNDEQRKELRGFQDSGIPEDISYDAIIYFLQDLPYVCLVDVRGRLDSKDSANNVVERVVTARQKNKDGLKYTVFILPVQGGSHAIGIVINESDHSIYYLDSENHTLPLQASSLLNRISYTVFGTETANIKTFPQGFRQQHRQWSCQAHAIANILGVINDQLAVEDFEALQKAAEIFKPEVVSTIIYKAALAKRQQELLTGQRERELLNLQLKQQLLLCFRDPQLSAIVKHEYISNFVVYLEEETSPDSSDEKQHRSLLTCIEDYEIQIAEQPDDCVVLRELFASCKDLESPFGKSLLSLVYTRAIDNSNLIVLLKDLLKSFEMSCGNELSDEGASGDAYGELEQTKDEKQQEITTSNPFPSLKLLSFDGLYRAIPDMFDDTELDDNPVFFGEWQFHYFKGFKGFDIRYKGYLKKLQELIKTQDALDYCLKNLRIYIMAKNVYRFNEKWKVVDNIPDIITPLRSETLEKNLINHLCLAILLELDDVIEYLWQQKEVENCNGLKEYCLSLFDPRGNPYRAEMDSREYYCFSSIGVVLALVDKPKYYRYFLDSLFVDNCMQTLLVAFLRGWFFVSEVNNPQGQRVTTEYIIDKGVELNFLYIGHLVENREPNNKFNPLNSINSKRLQQDYEAMNMFLAFAYASDRLKQLLENNACAFIRAYVSVYVRLVRLPESTGYKFFKQKEDVVPNELIEEISRNMDSLFVTAETQGILPPMLTSAWAHALELDGQSNRAEKLYEIIMKHAAKANIVLKALPLAKPK